MGKAACAWSNREEMPPAAESIKLSLLRQARERNASFVVIGIAPDWAPERGIAHLSKFGRFDEIATGSSWSNTLAGTLEGFAGRGVDAHGPRPRAHGRGQRRRRFRGGA